jgi:transposase
MAGEVLSGPERRRRWSSEEKAGIVSEVMQSGAKVAEIARRHGISRSLLYTWRREAGQAAAIGSAASPLPDLVPVMITDGTEVSKRPALPAERVGATTKGIGTIEIVLPGGVRVTVRGRIEERSLRAVLDALRSV